MEHVLTYCGLTEDAVETALTAVEKIRGEAVEATVDLQTFLLLYCGLV